MIQYLKKDGATIWVSESAGKVADNTGKTLYYYGFCIDITAKKIAEQTIMEQEKTYRRLFTTMTQGVMYFDAEGQIVMANPAVEHIFGTPVKDMVGHQPSFRWKVVNEQGEVVPASEWPVFVSLRTGKTVQQHVLGIKPPQLEEYIWLSVSSTPLFQAGSTTPYQIYSVFEDITEQKKAELALAEEKRKYRLLADNVDDVIWVTNLDRQFTYVSPSVEKLRGITVEEALSETVFDIMPPDSLKRALSETQRVWSDEKRVHDSVRIEVELFHKKGDTIWAELIFRQLLDKTNKPYSFVGVTRNITNAKATREKLILAKQVADEAVQSKADFLAFMTHEIRTPMNGIHGIFQLLDMTTLDQDQQSYVDTGLQAVSAMTDLMNNILDFSKLEAGKMDVNHTAFELSQLIHSVPKLFQPKLQTKIYP